MKRKLLFNNLFLIFGIFCLVYYLGMGIFIRFGQSLLFLWPLVGCYCLLRYFLVRRSLRSGKPLPFPRFLIVLWKSLVTLLVLFFLFVECFIFAGSFERAPDRLDAVIVLGAKVNGREPSGSLNERIHAAADYLQANPDTLCIASGGRGDDENISEAECIRENLIALGVDSGRILLEEHSTDTVENLTNSFPLLPDGTETLGVVTNDFHIFRALCTARHLGGYDFYGVPARSSVFGYIHYAMREFCGLVVGTLKGELRFPADALRTAQRSP